jgi:hypothetical protein
MVKPPGQTSRGHRASTLGAVFLMTWKNVDSEMLHNKSKVIINFLNNSLKDGEEIF